MYGVFVYIMMSETKHQLSVPVLNCLKCGHQWITRILDGRKPLRCPKCHNTNWELAKYQRKNGEKNKSKIYKKRRRWNVKI